MERPLAGLQITLTLADQNLLMSDEIPSVVGHNVRTKYFDRKSFYDNNE